VIIDPDNHLDSPLLQLNNAKTQSPLVIVDPVQPDRNSAAALSRKAFETFRSRAKEYLAAKESEKRLFFRLISLDENDFAKLHGKSKTLMISLVPLNGKKDVVGAKCLKVYEHCASSLLKHGFVIDASEWEFNEKTTKILFAVRDVPLPRDIDIVGPPVHKTADVARFKAVHKNTFTHESRAHALERRKYVEARALLSDIIKSKYVMNRVNRSSIKVIIFRNRR
jgi:tRNA nucleotidyltransferase (CCA-adding enzyme)